MRTRQSCQSEAAARLSAGPAIAVPAITIFLESSLSTSGQHRREEPKAVDRAKRSIRYYLDTYGREVGLRFDARTAIIGKEQARGLRTWLKPWRVP